MRRVRVVGLGLAGAAVVLWAVGMTVLQPLAEPLGPWSERLPGNDTYWARDLRFLAIFTVVVALVLAGGGDRRWSSSAMLLGASWVAADVVLDRADVTGAPATVLLVATGWTGTGLLAWFLARRYGTSDRPLHWMHRRRLGIAAAVAATLLLVAAGLSSATNREPELTPATLAAGLLLLVAALGCALAAAPAPDRRRAWWAVALGVAGAAGLVGIRLLAPEQRLLPLLPLGTALLAGTTLLSWDWPDGRPRWRRHALTAVGTLLGLPMAGFVAGLATVALPVGATLTAWAGNLTVADRDLLYSLIGLLTGLLLGLVLAWPNALGYRPEPTGPAGPAGPTGTVGPTGVAGPVGTVDPQDPAASGSGDGRG